MAKLNKGFGYKHIFISILNDIKGIYNLIVQNINSLTIECIGPEIISLKEIIQKLLKLIGKKRLLIPVPLFIAKLSAIFF